jgi:hypothetical protein
MDVNFNFKHYLILMLSSMLVKVTLVIFKDKLHTLIFKINLLRKLKMDKLSTSKLHLKKIKSYKLLLITPMLLSELHLKIIAKFHPLSVMNMLPTLTIILFTNQKKMGICCFLLWV